MSYLFNQVDSWLQVQSKVYELPLDSFSLVLLLLQDEHGVVEQLLQLLVGEVDAELLEAVEVEDLKAGNIKDTNKTCSLPLGSVQASVDSVHYPFEQSLVGSLGDGLHGELDLFLALGLGHVVSAHLDPGLEEGLGEVSHLDAKEVGHLLSHGVVRQGGLVARPLLLELHVAEQETAGDDPPDGGHVLLTDPHHPHGVLSGGKLLDIINARHPHSSRRHEGVVLGVIQQQLG